MITPHRKGGAMFGLSAGILINFPTWIMLHLFIRGFSYAYAWFFTIYGIVGTLAAGAIIASIYECKPTETSGR